MYALWDCRESHIVFFCHFKPFFLRLISTSENSFPKSRNKCKYLLFLHRKKYTLVYIFVNSNSLLNEKKAT